MRTIILIALLLLACSAQAQTAKVITLSDQDAQTAKRLYTEAQRAQSAYDKFKESITARYVPHGNTSTGTLIWSGGGYSGGEWLGGFEFSENFHAIVPLLVPKLTTTGMFTIGDPCIRY